MGTRFEPGTRLTLQWARENLVKNTWCPPCNVTREDNRLNFFKVEYPGMVLYYHYDTCICAAEEGQIRFDCPSVLYTQTTRKHMNYLSHKYGLSLSFGTEKYNPVVFRKLDGEDVVQDFDSPITVPYYGGLNA